MFSEPAKVNKHCQKCFHTQKMQSNSLSKKEHKFHAGTHVDSKSVKQVGERPKIKQSDESFNPIRAFPGNQCSLKAMHDHVSEIKKTSLAAAF